MLQNAHQIQTIVNEAFPDHCRGGHSLLKDCSNTQNDGEFLSCLWSEIKTVFTTEHYPANSLQVLVNVSCKLLMNKSETRD